VWEDICSGADKDMHASEMTLLAYYMAAVREKEREHMPLIGPSVDRRTLSMVHKLCRDDTVKGMVCCVCAQVHTHVSSWNRMWKPPAFVGTEAEIKAQETAWRQDPCNKY
jgi:serine/threonine-protein kinase RIO1